MIAQNHAASIPRMVEALATHTDPTSSRYALGAIKIEARENAGVAIATDGRRLAIVRFPSETEGETNVLVGTKDFQSLCRAAKPKATIASARPELRNVTLRTVGDVLSGQASDGESDANLTLKQVEGRFPDWKRLFPESRHKEGITVRLDAKFLKEAAELFERIGTSPDARALFLTVSNSSSPVYLWGTNPETGASVEVVMMPMDAARTVSRAS